MPLFDTATIGTATNLITFNDDTTDPYYRAQTRTLNRREISEFDIKLPEGTGDADWDTWIGKTYLVISGTMYPNDETSFDNGKKALRKLASLDVSQADSASDLGYVPYKWSENDGYDKLINVKVIYVDIPESTRNGLKLPFRLICKIKYPVILAQAGVTASIGSSTATISGSSGLPFGLPKGIGSTSYSSNGTITNGGDLPVYPSITIYGPITTPRITNSTTGEYIELGITLATSSDSVLINYDQDSVSMTQAGTNVLGNLTSTSTLFKLRTGINTLTLTGSSVGSGANAQVTAAAAWPLS